MFYEDNNIAKLLNMEDVIVTKVENLPEELHVYLELPRKDHVCPQCGRMTSKVHDYRQQKIKDIPFGRTTYLYLRKRRYVCPECGKRFAEKNPLVPRYYRLTRRSVVSIIQQLKSMASSSEVARKHNVSVTSVLRYFKPVQYSCSELPEVLSIDEFKGDTNGEKYQTILTDAGKKKVLDILPNRMERDLKTYFLGFKNRETVKYFVCDMNPHFRAVARVCFPNAKIVADRYHVIRQVIWAMEAVRKSDQEKYSKQFRRYFKRSRILLNKKSLSQADKLNLALMLENAPRLAKAYSLKNKFLDVMHTKNDPAAARKNLSDWFMEAEPSDLQEFKSCITAYRNWSEEILNSLDVRYSNGFTEGCNNKTKVLKRICFGFRNFDNFRLKEKTEPPVKFCLFVIACFTLF